MSFPASLDLVTLSGTFLNGDGDARSGTVTIVLPTTLRSESDDVVVPPFTLETTLDETGHFEVEVPSTNDAQWLPSTGRLIVQAVFSDFVKLWWTIVVPFDAADARLDMADCGEPFIGTPSHVVMQGVSNPTADGAYKGVWAADRLYRVGDTVERSGAVYGALKASAGITPGTASTTWRAYPGGGGGGGGAVSSVFGRDGDVVAAANDYAVADISGLTAALSAKADGAATTSALAGKASTTSVSDLSSDTATALSLKADAAAVSSSLTGKANLSGGAAFTGTITVGGQVVVVTNDARLTNSRTPTAHAASHGVGQSDAVTVAQSQVTSLTTDLAAKADAAAMTSALALKAPLASPTFTGTVGGITKAMVGLGSVDDTTDAGKPVSTAQQTALNLKANLAGPTFTGTVGGITKAMVGLSAVDNTADTGKPVSTAQQTALNLKADIAGPTFTGTVTAPRIITPPVVLTPGTTVAVNAASGNYFRLTPGQNFTLANPTNLTDGQLLMFEIIQDGTGSRILTLDTKYALGADITAVVLSTGINKVDYLGCRYNSTADKLRVIAFVKGY